MRDFVAKGATEEAIQPAGGGGWGHKFYKNKVGFHFFVLKNNTNDYKMKRNVKRCDTEYLFNAIIKMNLETSLVKCRVQHSAGSTNEYLVQECISNS